MCNFLVPVGGGSVGGGSVKPHDTMQYNKTPCVGKLPERLAKACARLKKIAVLPLSVDDKAKMISSAVLPAALHACENTAIQDRHLQRLRTRITEALDGQKGKPNLRKKRRS